MASVTSAVNNEPFLHSPGAVVVDIYCTANVNMNPACLMQTTGISANGPVYTCFGRALSKVYLNTTV